MSADDYEIGRLKEEISKLDKSIEWYKATYEKRRFLGIIKTKLSSSRKTKKLDLNPLSIVSLKFDLRGILKLNKKTKLSDETFCAIVNHNNNGNAKKLYTIFSRYFITQVIDS